MSKEAKPIDVEGMQLRKHHLFNECNHDKVFPFTYAKMVTYVDGENEVDLQTYLESLTDAIGNISPEADTSAIEDDIADLKDRMDALESAVAELTANVQAICDFLHISVAYNPNRKNSGWTAVSGAWRDNGVAYFKSNTSNADGGGLFGADAILAISENTSDTVGTLEANKFIKNS